MLGETAWSGQARLLRNGADDLTAAMRVMHQEADACQCQGNPEPCVEECYEPGGDDAKSPKGDATAHHDGHDDVPLHIEEAQDVHLVFSVAADAISVLAYQLAEHGMERQEYGRDPQDEQPEGHASFGAGGNTQSCDVDTGQEPDRCCYQKEVFRPYTEHGPMIHPPLPSSQGDAFG